MDPERAATDAADSAFGAVEVLGGTGRTILETEVALSCRCGQSRSELCCDGSCALSGLRSEKAVSRAPASPSAA